MQDLSPLVLAKHLTNDYTLTSLLILLIVAVIYPRHADVRKLDKTAWSLSTFHAYVNYHVKVQMLPHPTPFFFKKVIYLYLYCSMESF